MRTLTFALVALAACSNPPKHPTIEVYERPFEVTNGARRAVLRLTPQFPITARVTGTHQVLVITSDNNPACIDLPPDARTVSFLAPVGVTGEVHLDESRCDD